MKDLKNIKVIFVDIDKTLTDNKRQVPKENAEAIKKVVKKGIMVVLCSGRNFSYAGQKATDANASEYLITNNGAQIYDYANHKSLYENPMSKETVEKLLKEFKKMKIECILNTPTTRFGTRNLVRKLDEDEEFFDNVDEIKDEEILQIVGEVKLYDTMKQMIEKVKEFDDLIISNLSRAFIENRKSENGYYADINDKSVNKGAGINKFLEMFNIKKEESMCFGDFINDLDMFEACGYKVAMGNASEELKQKADYVTLSNEEAGIAYFLNKYMLNQ